MFCELKGLKFEHNGFKYINLHPFKENSLSRLWDRKFKDLSLISEDRIHGIGEKGLEEGVKDERLCIKEW